MLCNVDLNFKFIGGSSLGGPITQLQNAVSSNFFANTALYNPRKIYQSVGKYKVSRPDPITKEITEIADISTYNEAGTEYGFGAFMTPQQSIKKYRDINNSGSISSNDISTKDKSKTTQNNQIIDQGLQSKNVAQEEKLKQSISEQSSTNQSLNSGNGGSGNGDVNKSGNENKTIKGFDKKTGRYTTQNDQIITFKPFGDKKTQNSEDYKKLKIPKGTIVSIFDLTVDGLKDVVIAKAVNTKTNKSVSNSFSLYCGGTEGLDFLSNSANGYEGLTNGGYYTNTPFANVLRTIFCNGNKTKTWKELTS